MEEEQDGRRVRTFEELAGSAPAEQGQGRVRTFEELMSGAGAETSAPVLDPRDVAAAAPAGKTAPYMGAVGQRNAEVSRIERQAVPGAAGIPGSALSDGMAEVVGFMRAVDEEAASREYRPPGAGVMWGYSGQKSLAPTKANAAVLGISPAPTIGPPSQPEMTAGDVASYLAGIPGRTARYAGGQVKAIAGSLTGNERLLGRGEREIRQVGLEESVLRPQSESTVANMALGAAESIVQLASGAILGALFGAPTAGALTGFGISSAGSTYAGLRSEGVPRGRAAVASAVSGTAEAATELIPTAKAIKLLGGTKMFKDMLSRQVARDAATYLGHDVGGEVVNSLVQNVAEHMAKNPDAPIGDSLREAARQTAIDLPQIVGQVGIQSLMMGAPRIAATATRLGRNAKPQDSRETVAAIEQMRQQQRQAAERALAGKEGTPVGEEERWETARRAFTEEKAEDGSTLYVAPSGARITPQQWESAGPRLRASWLQPRAQEKAEEKPRTPTPEEILQMRPDEQLTAKPAPLVSERLSELQKQRREAIGKDVRERIDREIKAERDRLEKALSAEEFARMAEEEQDPARKALLWNAAAKLVAPREQPQERPTTRGIQVKEIPIEAQEPLPKVSTRGIEVRELSPEQVEARGIQEAPGAKPEEVPPEAEAQIGEYAEAQREAEFAPLAEQIEGGGSGPLISAIAASRRRVADLRQEAERMGQSAAAAHVRRMASSERRKLGDLVAASEMMAEASATRSKQVADELLAKAQALARKHGVTLPVATGPERTRGRGVVETARPAAGVRPEVPAVAPPVVQPAPPAAQPEPAPAVREAAQPAAQPTAQPAAQPEEARKSAPVRKPARKKAVSKAAGEKKSPKAKAGDRAELRAKYFTPGNVVKGYGGFDEVLEYKPPAEGGRGSWSVRVHEVRKDKDGKWVRVGRPQNARWHATEPDVRELESGPVDRLPYERGAQVGYVDELSGEVSFFERSPDRGVRREAAPETPAADWERSIPPGSEEGGEAAQWQEEHDLSDADAARAAIVRRASEIDAAAVERAAIAFADDDAGFMRAVREIIDEAERGPAVPEEGEEEPAVRGRAGDAGARVQEVAGVTEGAPDLAKGEQEGGAADQGAAGREPGAVADRSGQDVAAGGTRLSARQHGGGAQRRTADLSERERGGGQEYLDEISERMSERFGEKIVLVEVDPDDAEAMMPRKAVQLRAVAEVFGRLGVKVRYYRPVGYDLANGFYDQGKNEIWVSVDSDKPFATVAGHEFGHWLKYHHRDLWDEFASAIDGDLNLPAYKAMLLPKYERDLYRRMEKDENVKEELISDVLGDLFSDTDFHARLMRENPSLYARIARAIKTFIDELLQKVLGKGSLPNETHKYVRDLQKARNHAVRMLSALGERVDKQAEIADSLRAAMESIGLPGEIDSNILHLSIAAKPLPSALVTLPEENTLEARLFDSFARVAQLEDEYMKQTGSALADAESVRLAETLFHGRVQHRVDAFEKKYLEPLGKALRELKKLKLTIRDADDYLMALHAPERNATLKLRDPQGRDGLSGMTDEDARNVLASFGEQERKALDEVAKRVREILDFRLDVLVDGGLIERASADALKKRWPNYVPLKTLEAESKELGTGVGFEMWANDIRNAFGRTTRASTPIGFALSDTVRSIVRAEKARVEQAVWRLANKPALAEIIRPYDPKNIPPQLKRKRLDRNTGEVREELDPAAYDRHVMSLVIDGRQQKVFVADETLLRQLRRAGEFEDVGAVLEAVGAFTRTLGRTLTEWNPNWFLPNAVKDAVAATIRAAGIKGMSAARMLVEIPRSWVDISAHKVGMRTAGARAYEEFLQAGAQTGAYGIEGPEEFLRKLHKRGADVGYLYGERSIASRLADPVRAILHAISVANEVVEYGTRFAAFKEARRAGYSIDRSAQIAKEITVNFNRRGEISRSMGSMFVFFNAAMQGLYGTTKFFGAGRDLLKPGSLERGKVIAGAAALMTLGAIMQAVDETYGGDDDETGEKFVNQYPDFTLDHNVSLTSKDGIWKLPLPPEYSVFYAIGRRLYRAASQGNVVREAAGIAGNVLDAALPLRISDETPAPVGLFKAITPSVLVPVAEVVSNTNFLGASIVPEQIGGGPPVPLYTLSRPTTSAMAKGLAKVLNSATGGTDVRPGAAQKILGPFASPEAMEHLTRAYTGGLGQTVMQASNVASRVLGKDSGVELAPSKMPVVARFYSERQPSYIDRMYRKVADSVQYEKRASKHGLAVEDEAAASIMGEYDAAERQLRPLYKRFRDAAESGDEKEKKALRDEIVKIKASVLKAYNTTSRAASRQ